MRVRVAVISWNALEHLRNCVVALDKQSVDDRCTLEVVAIDNNSQDGSVAALSSLSLEFPWLKTVFNDENLGFAGAANQGLDLEPRPDVFVTLNPDVVLSNDFLRRAIGELEQDPELASVAPLLVRPDGSVDSAGHVFCRPRLFRNRGEGESEHAYQASDFVFGVTGAAAIYRVDSLEAARLKEPRGQVFDEEMFAFFEDIDLDWRLQRLGYRCRFVPSVRAVHVRGVARKRASNLVEKLNYRNRLRAIWRNDSLGGFAWNLPGFLFTTSIKTADLLVTHPSSLFRALIELRLGKRPKGVRPGSSVVPAERFSYRSWFKSHF